MAELTQWEYKQVELKNNTEEFMNKLGSEGWELVTTTDGYNIKVIYKRPKQPQTRSQPANYGYGY